ncbi:hypothetical protein JJJ17_15960 [Paracoccus caeni]|uniref:Uncharacterized protein n=1 Tax=Paracoccus caeni TaxID=657651 RepID=A0A934W247_9RHOB|nr:hypothetical protein [Paracoccus caeni]MBK4217424.1 hypothetical protein [Paracoccus caeni]
MRHLLWIILALLLLSATALIAAKTSLLDLRRDREWRPTEIATDSGLLDGVEVRLQSTRAVTTPAQEGRALLHLRLAVTGPLQAREGWINCRVTLTDPQGRVWAPVETELTDGAVRTLAADGQNNGRCNPLPYDAPGDGEAILSDSVFVVPVEVLTQLRLNVSGFGTRPRALSMPIRPALMTLQ